MYEVENQENPNKIRNVVVGAVGDVDGRRQIASVEFRRLQRIDAAGVGGVGGGGGEGGGATTAGGDWAWNVVVAAWTVGYCI